MFLEAENTKFYDKPFLNNKMDEVVFYKCPCCGLIQCNYLLNKDFYANRHNNVDGFNEYHGGLKNIHLKRLQKLVSLCHQNKSILEVGCGTGLWLEQAAMFFDNCVGVDPALSFCSKNHKINFINKYFDSNLNFKQKFDAIVSLMVFEHLENPCVAMSYLSDILDDNGIGMVNVPNGYQIFTNGLYGQIVPQHINYYTINSIIFLLNKFNLEVVSIDIDESLIEITVYFKKRKFVDLKKSILVQKQRLTEILTNRDNIVLWGAGNKIRSISYILKDFHIKHLVDSDALKTHKYIPNLNCAIELLSREIISNADTIFITASGYNAEIVREINKMRQNTSSHECLLVYIDHNNEVCSQLIK